MTQLCRNGEKVATPVLTSLEKKLARMLVNEDFGDFEDPSLLTVSADGSILNGGYQRIKFIKWGNRKELGGIITSLVEKHVLVAEDDPDGNALWFDIDTLKSLI